MEAYPEEVMGAINFLSAKPKPLPSQIEMDEQKMSELIEDSPTNNYVLKHKIAEGGYGAIYRI